MFEATLAILILVAIVSALNVAIIWISQHLHGYFRSRKEAESLPNSASHQSQEEVIRLRFWPPHLDDDTSRWSRFYWKVNWLAGSVIMPFNVIAAYLMLEHGDLWMSRQISNFFYLIFVGGLPASQ